MEIKTAYMGKVEINPSNIISFEHGIPGFEDEKEFVQLPISDESVFQVLQSVKQRACHLLLQAHLLL